MDINAVALKWFRIYLNIKIKITNFETIQTILTFSFWLNRTFSVFSKFKETHFESLESSFESTHSIE